MKWIKGIVRLNGKVCNGEYSLEKKKEKMQFSKIVLSAVMLTYFAGLIFAIYAVNKILMDYPEWAIQALISLFGYIGAPISISIGFYSWKAKNENMKKIGQSNKNINLDE